MLWDSDTSIVSPAFGTTITSCHLLARTAVSHVAQRPVRQLRVEHAVRALLHRDSGVGARGGERDGLAVEAHAGRREPVRRGEKETVLDVERHAGHGVFS